MDQALLAIYHANQEHAWTENLLGEVEDALDRAGLWSKAATIPAICFLDISGYTRLTEERGDRAAAELVTRLAPLVERPAERHGGKVVKRLGDGVMLHFRDPREAVVAALEMIEAVSAASMPPAHIGIDAGPVVFEGGDYFGRTVNIAARIAEHAEPGQVLVSQEVVDRRRLVGHRLHLDRLGRPEGRLPRRGSPLGAARTLNRAVGREHLNEMVRARDMDVATWRTSTSSPNVSMGCTWTASTSRVAPSWNPPSRRSRITQRP